MAHVVFMFRLPSCPAGCCLQSKMHSCSHNETVFVSFQTCIDCQLVVSGPRLWTSLACCYSGWQWRSTGESKLLFSAPAIVVNEKSHAQDSGCTEPEASREDGVDGEEYGLYLGGSFGDVMMKTP